MIPASSAKIIEMGVIRAEIFPCSRGVGWLSPSRGRNMFMT
jgi:hypothetical protein